MASANWKTNSPNAYYVSPAIVEMPEQSDVVCTETFAPILYVVGYSDFAEALRLNNAVPQGLSSCIFTTDVREAEQFMSAVGSDCGIANVNIGPSGAEIGGAFGGEKETGGGRESGSDAWRGVHASPDQYRELLAGTAAGPGHYLRLITLSRSAVKMWEGACPRWRCVSQQMSS